MARNSGWGQSMQECPRTDRTPHLPDGSGGLSTGVWITLWIDANAYERRGYVITATPTRQIAARATFRHWPYPVHPPPRKDRGHYKDTPSVAYIESVLLWLLSRGSRLSRCRISGSVRA